MQRKYFLLYIGAMAIATLLLEAFMGRHDHQPKGWYMPPRQYVNGKPTVILWYRCERDTAIRTTVDSITYYAHYMHSSLPYGFAGHPEK